MSAGKEFRRMSQLAWGAGGLRFKSGRPTIEIHSNFMLLSLRRLQPVLGSGSCDTSVRRTKPRPIFSHDSRRYFTSPRSCSAYCSVRPCARVPFTFSPDPTADHSYVARKHAKDLETTFFYCPFFFQKQMQSIVQNTPPRQRFTARCSVWTAFR